MQLLELRPIIWSEQLRETIDFYTQTLGFACGEVNEEWGWAALQKNNVEIMVAKPNAHMPFERPVFTGSFYIRTDDVDTLWENLKDKVRIVYALEAFEWGMREFAVYDNNGYILQFGQSISNNE